MTTCTASGEESTLFRQANDCAKSLALNWIRSVFCQVSVETLKQLWTTTTTTSTDNNINNNTTETTTTTTTTTVLRVTHQDLEVCEQTCMRLGTLWCQRLYETGRNQMAEWVRHVMEREGFWNHQTSPLQVQQDNNDVPPSTKDNSTTEPQAAIVKEAYSTTASVTALKQEQEEQLVHVEPLPLALPPSKLIMTKIRHLGQRRDDNMASSYQSTPSTANRVSRTLDQLGRQKQTEWPYNWSIVEQAAETNVKRLHLETIRGRPRRARAAAAAAVRRRHPTFQSTTDGQRQQPQTQTQYEVVPKSLIDREKQSKQDSLVAAVSEDASSVGCRAIRKSDKEEEDDDETKVILASSERLAELVERKRKAAAATTTVAASPPEHHAVSEVQRSKRLRRNEQQQHVSSPSSLLATIARKPCEFGHNDRLSWKDNDVVRSLSEQERNYLDHHMIHHSRDNSNGDDGESNGKELHSVLGALKPVGDVHSFLERQEEQSKAELENDDNDDDGCEWTDKKRRRQERKYRKQRLFPHEIGKEDDRGGETKQRLTSKLIRTIDDKEERHWMELDMGECLLDCIDLVDPAAATAAEHHSSAKTTSSQKKLYAFSSLEVMLLDEDIATTTMSTVDVQ